MSDMERIKRALRKVISDYGCNGNHDSDLISDAFQALLNRIEYDELKEQQS